jgi:hypothetical protein
MGIFSNIVEKVFPSNQPEETPSPSPAKGFSFLNIVEKYNSPTPTILPEVMPDPSPASVNPELYNEVSLFEQWRQQTKPQTTSDEIIADVMEIFKNDPIQAREAVKQMMGINPETGKPKFDIADPSQIDKAYAQLGEMTRDKEIVPETDIGQVYKQSQAKKGIFTNIIEQYPQESTPQAAGEPPPDFNPDEEIAKMNDLPVEKIVDYASISNYMVGNVVYDAIDGGDFDIVDDLLNAITLRDKKTWYDILDKIYPGMPEKLKFWGGLGLDVVTDPLTYFSFFKVTKAGEQFKTVRSALLRGEKIGQRSKLWDFYQNLLGRTVNIKGNPMVITDDLIKQGLPMGSLAQLGYVGAINFDPGVPGLNKINVPVVSGESAWKAWDSISELIGNSEPYVKTMSNFRYAVGTGDVRAMGETAEDWINYRSGMVKSNEKIQAGYQRVVQRVSKNTNIPVENLWKEIQQQAEEMAFGTTRGSNLPTQRINLPTELNYIVAQTKALNEELYLIDQVLGNTYTELGDMDYVLHAMLPEAKKKMNLTSGQGYAKWAQNHTSEISRLEKFRGYTTVELNWLWENTNELDNWFPELAQQKDKFEKVFIENTAINNAIRYEKTANALATANFMDEVYTFGWDSKLQGREPAGHPENWVRLNNNTISKLNDTYQAQLNGVFFDPSVAHIIDKTVNTFTDPVQMKAYVKYYDEFMTNWKKLALATPGWNIRNVPQIAYCAYIDDISPEEVYEYVKFMTNPNGGRFRNNIGKIVTTDEFITNLQTWNMTDSGLFGANLKAELYPKNKVVAGLEKAVDVYSSPFFAINSFMENHVRGMSVYKRVKGGMPFRDAIREVRHLFGDPGNIPQETGQWMKRAFPWWGWMQYNIPFQISTALHEPGKAMVLQKYFRDKTISSGVPEEARASVPDWARRSGLYFQGVYPAKEEGGLPKIRYGVQEGVNPQWDALKYLNMFQEVESGIQGGKIAQFQPHIEELFQNATPVAKAIMAAVHLPLDQFARIYDPNQYTNFLGGWMPNWTAELAKTIPPLVTANNLNLFYVFGNAEQGKPSWLGNPAPSVSREWETGLWKYFTGERQWETEPVGQLAKDVKRLENVTVRDVTNRISNLLEQQAMYQGTDNKSKRAKRVLQNEIDKLAKLLTLPVHKIAMQAKLMGIDLNSLIQE